MYTKQAISECSGATSPDVAEKTKDPQFGAQAANQNCSRSCRVQGSAGLTVIGCWRFFFQSLVTDLNFKENNRDLSTKSAP